VDLAYRPKKGWSQVLPESVHVLQESPWMLDGTFQFIHMEHRLSSFEMVSNMHAVMVARSPFTTYELKRGTKVRRVPIPSGSISVVAAYSDYHAYTDGSFSEDLGFLFNPARIHELVSQDENASATVDPRDGFGLNDARSPQILRMFAEDLASATPFGTAYREGLLGAFARHFATTYASAPAITAPESALSPQQLRRVEEFIETNLAEDLSLGVVAEVTGYSRFHFHRLFKAATGMPLYRFILVRRVERAKELLLMTNQSLTEITVEVGFRDHGHLARHFKAFVGMAPSQFRSHSRR
jgi:AraC-like DNA-binding protein